MKETILEAGKSFWVFANSVEKGCFNCAYCVLFSVEHINSSGRSSGFRELEIGVPPSRIDARMSEIPVSVNNALGDPVLQWNDTIARLELLAEYEHRGVVGVITKGELSERQVLQLQRISKALNLVVLESVSGLSVPLEPNNLEGRIRSIKRLREAEVPVLGYLRPIIPGFNDQEEKIVELLNSLAENGLQFLSYAGLMGKREVISQLEKVTGCPVEPPPAFSEWQRDKKLVEPGLRALIENYAKQLGMQVFRKTSCAVSVVAGLEADYNLHMHRPDKYNCASCSNRESCYAAKDKINEDRIAAALEILQTEGKVVENEETMPCPLKDACDHSLPTCYTHELYNLVLQGMHTMGEIALARWLAAIPVSAETIDKSTKVPDLWHVT